MRRIILFFPALVIALAIGQDASGQVYKYTDKDGNIVLTDNPAKAAGQKDSEKISDLDMSGSSGPQEDPCYHPEPVGVSHGTSFGSGGASSGSSYSYDYQEMKAYRECIKRGGKKATNPKDAEGYVERGMHYAQLGNHQQAISDYNKAIEMKSSLAYAYVGRGVAYGWLMNYPQAISDFDRAIELKPNYAGAYVARATAYRAIGNQSQMINDYRIAAKLGNKMAQDFLRSSGIAW